MKKTIGLLFVILASVQSAYAFDESRKGFFIGVGGGAHTTSIDFNTSESLSEIGFASSFKIGGGFTDNFVLYYVRNEVPHTSLASQLHLCIFMLVQEQAILAHH